MNQVNWTDKRVLLRHYTIFKAANQLLLFLSFHVSRLIKKPVMWGRTSTLSIEPTTSCNLRCPECPSGLRSFTRPTGMLDFNNLKNFIDSTYKSTVYLNFYFQGEPYLNPHFTKMVEYAVSKNIYCAASTNAHFLSPEMAELTVLSGLQRLIISVDGTTQETYKSYRVGGDLSKVITGTKNIVNAKKKLGSNTPHLIFQFLVVKPNEHQIPEVFKLADELGVNEVRLKTAQIYNFENGSPLIPENNAYSRYIKNSDGSYRIKNKLLNQCWKMWMGCVITWDGKVLPCCFDKDGKYVMGKLPEQSFDKIWQSSSYFNFRSKLLLSRKEIDICQNCTEGTEVFTSQ